MSKMWFRERNSTACQQTGITTRQSGVLVVDINRLVVGTIQMDIFNTVCHTIESFKTKKQTSK